MNSAMSGLAKFMEYHGDNLEAIGACPTFTSWKVDFHGMAGVTQAWWVAAVKALTAWLNQSANEDLHTLQINCLARVTFDSPQLLTVPGLQREVLGQDGTSDRHALTQVIARATRIRECASKVEAVYVYEKKGAFRTMLKHARVVCGVQLLLERRLDIQQEPSEEECAKMAKACLDSLNTHKFLGSMPKELLQEVRSVCSTKQGG